ncbi:5-carboxymethyl-2-hydroxymuconate Delta-isomerase [Biformimicrobium ophioploci]|uniref:5-carboxymethyl-2-hydroxymuconate Delta-isomerase n=1 Tax=Biformimicrobium ophioploci TaxID=3036711 RepID=A0ABQ6LZC4_9GAMM|nr:5-carboxymethyl-2-hydroxymuconate Delta-isomerase [Microbulbifer sp. NKW57]GMG87445.1 5-carboxymethyl-2-hydroxymuconate Delta-isomerase [Microbulbifer sp. NKW57]
MPHLVIEYSADIEEEVALPALISAGHKAMVDSGLFNSNAIKSRAIPVQHYIAGEHDASFIHAEVRILDGRTSDQKRALSEQVFNALCRQAETVPAVSVEVRDMERDCYSKRTAF